MNKNIIVVGSSNTDMIVKIAHIPKPGETVIGGEFSTAAGGKGANQAVAVARAGGAVIFIARVGKDMLGEQAVSGFIRDSLNVERIIRDSHAPSGVALIIVDENGENSIAVASGANANLLPSDIGAAGDDIAAAGILVTQLEIPLDTVEKAVSTAYENGVGVILNPAPAQPLSDSLLSRVSILTPNETEAEMLTGIAVDNEKTAEYASQALLDKGVSTVLITMGQQGVFTATSGFTGMIPGFAVQAVDTTAAGDIFNGALAVSLVEGNSLYDAVRFANAAAALSVTRLGAQPSAPNREEIDLFLKKNLNG